MALTDPMIAAALSELVYRREWENGDTHNSRVPRPMIALVRQ